MTLHRIHKWLSTIFLVTLITTGFLLVAGCGDGDTDGGAATAPPATEPPVSASPTTPPDTPTAPAPTDTAVVEDTTAETLAEAGEGVYAEHCVACHGEQGGGGVGPAVMGESARLGSYGTAEALYNYIHLAMPQNAPGTLTDEQYLEVTTFLLLQNDFVQADTPVNMERLSEIQLE